MIIVKSVIMEVASLVLEGTCLLMQLFADCLVKLGVVDVTIKILACANNAQVNWYYSKIGVLSDLFVVMVFSIKPLSNVTMETVITMTVVTKIVRLRIIITVISILIIWEY